jgi:hypothetical protein
MHTPGPWKIYTARSDNIYIGTINPDPELGWKHDDICYFYEDISERDENPEYLNAPNHLANARLIAAAPDLLAALRAAYPMLEAHEHTGCDCPDTEASRLARAALRKATSG